MDSTFAVFFFGGRKREVGRFPPGYSDGHPFFISDPLVSIGSVGFNRIRWLPNLYFWEMVV